MDSKTADRWFPRLWFPSDSSQMSLVLLIEVLTVGCFLACAVHAYAVRGREALWLFSGLLGLGFVRENFVALHHLLYEFKPLTFQLGLVPLIGSVIWGYSIYLAIVWAEGDRGPLEGDFSRPAFILRTSLFMMALACFYEPLLELLGMAKWGAGTKTTLGIPWIALVGYPSLTAGFLVVWEWCRRYSSLQRGLRAASLLTALALFHAVGLQTLKSWLEW